MWINLIHQVKADEVEKVKSGKLYKGTDEHGEWTFQSRFGDKANDVTFAFGELKWTKYESSLQALLILFQHPGFPVYKQFIFEPNGSVEDLVEIKTKAQLEIHAPFTFELWKEFFLPFAGSRRSTLTTTLPKPVGEMSKKDWSKFLAEYANETGSLYSPETEEEVFQEWCDEYPWDNFLHSLWCQNETGELVTASPEHLVTDADIEQITAAANAWLHDSINSFIAERVLENRLMISLDSPVVKSAPMKNSKSQKTGFGK